MYNLRLRLPLFSFCGSHSLDVFLGVYRLCAAVGVKEELTVLGYVKRLLVACGIAELTKGALLNDSCVFGIVLNLANNLYFLHNIITYKL